ncbi:MAG: hydroxyisourate hydrolase [Ferruginibacter sp.]|nr:hydroxyisourate hydrolase [Ferruginibacter sp.]
MSQVTTHVLDTSKGKPAWGIAIVLYEQVGQEWFEIAKGITNKEGRLTNLLQEDEELALGIYKITFDIKHYFSADDIATFYPAVEIIFEINTIEHYHIPLLVSPFGYSTYRGC